MKLVGSVTPLTVATQGSHFSLKMKTTIVVTVVIRNERIDKK
jgi:hypothetical protein